MHLLLVRHGNTFEEGAPSVWVGSRTDLPLTATGLAQAQTLGSTLHTLSIPISALYSGPLLRHRQHAAIVAQALGRLEQTVIIDARLKEIDYGVWEGKTNEEIRQAGQETTLHAWNEAATWPPPGLWGEDEQALQSRVRGFLATAQRDPTDNGTHVAITSGGVLKYFYKQAIDSRPADPQRSTKVATGHVCSLLFHESNWKVQLWNVPPGELRL